MTQDEKYMRMALTLAKKGAGMTSPNPMVGAVVVKDGRITGIGFHEGPGRLHAEAAALRDCGTEAEGATLYINLEPCCHKDKRTPPCTKEIIKSRIKRVVIGMEDPNPMVNGRGMRELTAAGILVDKGVLHKYAVRLNEAYSKFITTNIPFVTLKIAASMDGKIALPSGESRWITGKPARRYSHGLRAMADAVMVGVGTVIADDPSLNVRHITGKSRQPLRIIVDSKLRVPLTARALNTSSGQDTMIATTRLAPVEKVERLREMDVKTLVVEGRDDGEVSLLSMMPLLGKRGLSSVLMEGGSQINSSALREGVVDKVVIIYSPRIIGGHDSIGMAGGTAPRTLDESIFLKDLNVRRLGEDIMIQGYVR